MPQWVSFLSQITTLCHLKIVYENTDQDAKAINMLNHLKVRDIETLKFEIKNSRKYDSSSDYQRKREFYGAISKCSAENRKMRNRKCIYAYKIHR